MHFPLIVQAHAVLSLFTASLLAFDISPAGDSRQLSRNAPNSYEYSSLASFNPRQGLQPDNNLNGVYGVLQRSSKLERRGFPKSFPKSNPPVTEEKSLENLFGWAL